MSRITYHTWVWVMSHTNESYHTYEWVMRLVNVSCHKKNKIQTSLCHSYMSHITYDIWVCVMSHMNESYQAHEWVMRRVTHMNVSRHKYTRVLLFSNESYHIHEWAMSRMHSSRMGWLRLVASLKLQVSFAEYHLFYRALLQKRPIIVRSLQVVATLYHTNSSHVTYEWVPLVTPHINESCHIISSQFTRYQNFKWF